MFTKIYGKVKEFIKENYKSLIVIFVVFLLFTIETSYSIYTPGGAINLNDRIDVEGGEEVTGSFNMAYVSVVKGTVPFVLIYKIIHDWDMVKKDYITIQGEDIEVTSVNNNISYITEEAKTNLKVGDSIISVNDQKIKSLEELKEVINGMDEGVKVNLKIKRDDKEKDAYATTYMTEDGLKLGVSILNTYDYKINPDVNIKSKSSEMGSSGGLMMSLTVYNQLVDEDITKGKKIVGTGTIDIEGNVGEIGGVKYKLIGAVKNKAEIFICPVENYEEAKKVAKDKDYDIKIISAKTFDEVLEKLKNV